MKTIVLYPHIGSGNHGCEAIVRSTKRLISKEKIILLSDNPREDLRYINDIDVELKKANYEIKRFTFAHMSCLIKKYLFRQSDAFYNKTFSPVFNNCKKNNVLLSIGGDIYCYDTPNFLYRVNSYLRNQGCKTVLWGCSVEPDYIDDNMAEDLKGYDLICARETITYEALKKINPNTILTVDPAFVLPKQETALPAKSYIGVNVSPMIATREQVTGIAMENYKNLIQYILENTKDTVALIPHVVWASNDDRKPLSELKKMFAENDRVVMVDDHDCTRQKYIISKCRIFVGARTHATIAAYSSCVPTLVVGYSVKAKGIAKDLFGRYNDYVIPVQSLKNKDDLVSAYCWIESNEESIRNHLEKIMPEYKKKTQLAVDALKKVMGE
ncbi:MAG: polysaccharide pyruvyl transferase family protein [Ruminococcus sp.]|nr:polysaccharide pyruvyl transferase family protein [Ruminococcus sp.]